MPINEEIARIDQKLFCSQPGEPVSSDSDDEEESSGWTSPDEGGNQEDSSMTGEEDQSDTSMPRTSSNT